MLNEIEYLRQRKEPDDDDDYDHQLHNGNEIIRDIGSRITRQCDDPVSHFACDVIRQIDTNNGPTK